MRHNIRVNIEALQDICQYLAEAPERSRALAWAESGKDPYPYQAGVLAEVCRQAADKLGRIIRELENVLEVNGRALHGPVDR